MNTKLFKGVATFTTPQDIEGVEYSFGAGTHRGERRLLVYDGQEARHFSNATSLKIVNALLEHRIYLIEATTAPPTYEEFLEMAIVRRVKLSEQDITKLEMIRMYLCSQHSHTHQGPDRKR